MPPAKDRIRFCAVPDGVRVAYAVRGRGTPLVAIFGNWSHLELDPQSPVWGPWIESLSRDHSLVRFDKRGTGLSDRNVENQSLDAYVADMEAVVDHLRLERFAVVCIGGGAPIAIAYACRHPERITHLVIHCGYVRGRNFRDSPDAQLGPAFVRAAELGWDAPDGFVRRQLASSVYIPDAQPEVHAAFDEAARLSIGAADAARNFAMNYAIDVRALAPLVRAPTLVLHSRHAELVPFAEGRLLASLIPDARLVPLDSRNFVLVPGEKAWETWLRETAAFLAAPSREVGPFDVLTARERDLALLISEGLDNAQIAARLSISEKTVRNHITRIFAKLKVETRAQAIVLAHRAGLQSNLAP